MTLMGNSVVLVDRLLAALAHVVSKLFGTAPTHHGHYYYLLLWTTRHASTLNLRSSKRLHSILTFFTSAERSKDPEIPLTAVVLVSGSMHKVALYIVRKSPFCPNPLLDNLQLPKRAKAHTMQFFKICGLKRQS
jgi:hypothetical protein